MLLLVLVLVSVFTCNCKSTNKRPLLKYVTKIAAHPRHVVGRLENLTPRNETVGPPAPGFVIVQPRQRTLERSFALYFRAGTLLLTNKNSVNTRWHGSIRDRNTRRVRKKFVIQTNQGCIYSSKKVLENENPVNLWWFSSPQVSPTWHEPVMSYTSLW